MEEYKEGQEVKTDVKHKVMKITPENAKFILAREKERGNGRYINRPVSRKYVKIYSDAMRNGKWVINGEAIQFSKEKELLNGFTRLNAIIDANIPIEMSVMYNIDKSTFDTFDTGKNRSTRDVFAVANIPNYSAASSIVNHYIDRVNNFNKRKILRRDALDEYYTTPDLYNEVTALASYYYKKNKLFNKSDIGGDIIYLIKNKKYSKDFVIDFFKKLFLEEENNNSMIDVLRERLNYHSLNKKYSETFRLKHALLIKAWNAYIAGKEFKTLIYSPTAEEYPVFKENLSLFN